MLSYTWNNVLAIPSTETIFEIGFTSNGQHFDKLIFQKVDDARYMGYCNGSSCTLAYDNGTWQNASLKKITFDTLPPPELLTFMESRASVDAKVSKVEINGATLIDISNDTVAANILAEGYTAHDKTGNTITGTLTQQSGKTVTPGTSNIVAVESGKYTTGTVYVKGDSNLTADNIKSGTSIFGVTGTYEGSSPNLQSKSVTYTSNGTATITPDAGYDGLSSVDVTVNVSGGGGATIPGIVELFTTSGLRYSPEFDSNILIRFSAWPNYFGVYCTNGNQQNIFIGPAVYFGDMAGHLTIDGAIEIIDVRFNDGFILANIYAYNNYYFLSDVEMTIETQ